MVVRALARAAARVVLVVGVVTLATLTDRLTALYSVAPAVLLAAVLFAAADRAERARLQKSY